MDIAEALDIVVARSRHDRYRQLCDPAHPDHDPAFIPLVLAMAIDPEPAPPPISPRTAEALRINALIRTCPWRGPAPRECGCLSRCAIGLGTRGLANYQDCAACISSAMPNN